MVTKYRRILQIRNKSNYKYLMIKSLPCINHLGEITFGTAIYKKNQEILLGGIYKVNDYLRLIYKDCLFIIDDNLEHLCFKMIRDDTE